MGWRRHTTSLKIISRVQRKHQQFKYDSSDEKITDKNVFLNMLKKRFCLERPAMESQCPAGSPSASASGKMSSLLDRRLAFEPEPLPKTTSDLQVGTIAVMSTLLVAGGLLLFRCFRRRRKTTDEAIEL